MTLSPDEVAGARRCLPIKAVSAQRNPGPECEVAVVPASDCPQGSALAWKECTLDAGAKLEITLTRDDGAKETLTLRPPEKCASNLAIEGLKVKRGDGGSVYRGTLKVEREGSVETLKIDAADIDEGTKAKLLAAHRRWSQVEEGWEGWCEVEIAEADPRTEPLPGPTLEVVLADVPTYCFMEAKKLRDTWRLARETVCLWTDGERVETIWRPTRLLPGQMTRVVVRGPGASAVSVRQEGAIGYELAIDDRTGTSIVAATRDEEAETPVGSSQIKYFEGRGAGAGSIILKKGDKDLPPIEIYYPTTFMGSIRFGFGIVGGPAVGREYASVKKAGSSTYEVVESSTARLAWEIVLAYSVYPEAFFGGRDYGARLFSRNNWGVGPTVGAGVVSVADGKVDVFKSLYLGLEFEPVRYFSIGAGPVLRRTDRLAEGYQVGSALVDDKVPTRTSVDVGWFVLITVSPQFMKTAFRGKE